jgi:hypothetical protein
MARTRAFALFVAVLLVLSGCKAFFDFNAFAGLDKAAVPNPSRYQGTHGLANLKDDLQSHAIMDALSGDPATVAIILANLDAEHGSFTTTVPTTADSQIAAILYSDLELQTTSGDDLVNNVADLLVNPPSSDIKSVLQSIVPADVAADPTKFANMVGGLLAANIAYQNLGASLSTLPAPADMNMGDVAQKAAVAYLMERVNAAVTADVNPLNPVDQMFKLINNQSNSITPGLSTTPANPLNPTGSGPPGWLKNIFDAAGAPYPA